MEHAQNELAELAAMELAAERKTGMNCALSVLHVQWSLLDMLVGSDCIYAASSSPTVRNTTPMTTLFLWLAKVLNRDSFGEMNENDTCGHVLGATVVPPASPSQL